MPSKPTQTVEVAPLRVIRASTQSVEVSVHPGLPSAQFIDGRRTVDKHKSKPSFYLMVCGGDVEAAARGCKGATHFAFLSDEVFVTFSGCSYTVTHVSSELKAGELNDRFFAAAAQISFMFVPLLEQIDFMDALKSTVADYLRVLQPNSGWSIARAGQPAGTPPRGRTLRRSASQATFG